MSDKINLRRVVNQRVIDGLEQELYAGCPNIDDLRVGCDTNLGIDQIPCIGCSIYLSIEDDAKMWII